MREFTFLFWLWAICGIICMTLEVLPYYRWRRDQKKEEVVNDSTR
jgi:hypothetical protein